MTASSKPTAVTLRTYQVGFGDCFVLTFHYSNENRHVLIDFGTTGTPGGKDKERLFAVAQDIKKQCGGKLHAVVATHRHRDHISGFNIDGEKSPGKIIASCKPDIVIQPWTEDPKARTDAKEATRQKDFFAAFSQMHPFAQRALDEAARLSSLPGSLQQELSFLGEDNLKNKSAVQNLMKMAKNVYVNAGSASGLEKILPGVKVWVLGPPNLKQSDLVRKQRSSDPDEFWQLQARFWRLQGEVNNGAKTHGAMFPMRMVKKDNFPVEARWFIEKACQVRGDQLLELVRILDSAMNNTSIILLFEVNGKRMLFPGDAQIENWSYALSQSKYRNLLRSVSLYKVGHHGSRNATPKSLWNLFEKRSDRHSPQRLKTVVSTMAGKHGQEKSKTEVPRRTLVRELEAKSEYFSTEELKGETLSHVVRI